MPQLSTTTALANAQKIAIAEARYQQDHMASASKIPEVMQLEKGEKSRVVPKMSRYTLARLNEGQDIVDEQTLGMSTVTLTASEVGGKIIVTDQLVDQNATTDIFRMIGKEFGLAGVRIMDTDTAAIFSSLNSGTTYGQNSITMSLANFAAIITKGKGKTLNPFIAESCVQHPHAVYAVSRTATALAASTNQRVNNAREERLLSDWWSGVTFNGCDLYEDGNLSVDSSNDCIGFIGQSDALVRLVARDWTTERERDASRRAWEVNYWSRWDVFQLDTTKGAPATFDAAAPTDTA